MYDMSANKWVSNSNSVYSATGSAYKPCGPNAYIPKDSQCNESFKPIQSQSTIQPVYYDILSK